MARGRQEPLLLLAVLGCWAAGAHAAFLEGQLSLRPVITTPMELITEPVGTVVSLSGSQAITVVFSRPVIALGSDFATADNAGGKVPFSLDCVQIPGKFRWVTTTIARFDADVPWPTDLHCSFMWNTNLTSYDGVPVNLTGIASRQLASHPLTMSVSDVLSELAENVTGGLWSANTGAPNDKLPEVPPDGRILLNFNYDVNLTMLQALLKLESADGEHMVPVKVGPCSTMSPWWAWSVVEMAASLDVNTYCAEVMPQEELTGQAEYHLTLPKGSKYNTLSGSTASKMTQNLYGLRSFKFPFLSFSNPYQTNVGTGYGTSYRRLDMWLVHGLSDASELTPLGDEMDLCEVTDPWAKSGSPCKQVPFNISMHDKGTARLSVPGLMPRRKYQLSVKPSANVTDGFGLPLESTNTSFWSNDIPYAFSGPSLNVWNSPVLFESGARVVWPIISMGDSSNSPMSAAVWRININPDTFVRDVKKLIVLMSGSDLHAPSYLGKPDTSLVAPETSATSADFNYSALSLGSGAISSVHVVHTCCRTISWPTTRVVSSSIQVVVQSSISASFVLTHDGFMGWVTNSRNGGPVKLAHVAIYKLVSDYDIGNSPPTLVGQCNTGKDGFCKVQITSDLGSNSRLVGVARRNSNVAIVSSLYWYSQPSTTPYVGTMVLDRETVKPGDELAITGYIQATNSNGDLSLPTSLTHITLSVLPSWRADGLATELVVPVDPEVGSFHVKVPVPANTSMSSMTLAATSSNSKKATNVNEDVVTNNMAGGMSGVRTAAPGSGGGSGTDSSITITSAAFTVSDPRQPTAQLTLTVPEWTPPKAKVEVTVQAISYIGSDVGNAVMTMTWDVGNSSGMETIETDTDGSGNATIDLSLLMDGNATKDGDYVNVEVVWIGPTRERIVQSGSVAVHEVAQKVTLDMLSDVSLPGVSFGVAASFMDYNVGAAIEGTPVTITLKLNDSSTEASSKCSAADVASVSTCTVTSGSRDPTACQMRMPCMGVYVLEGCTAARAAAGGQPDESVCTRTYLGQNETQWEAEPLSSHLPFSLTANQSKYKKGDTAMLYFQNHWKGASVFLNWGNDNQMERTVFELLPKGIQKLVIPIGDECKTYCSLLAVLSVPRLQAANYLPASLLPSSKLFDPLAPHQGTFTMNDIALMEDRSLNVTVAVGTGSTEAVLAPGEMANITVSVKYDGAAVSNAEVTIFAVDKSWLDLLPYPLRPDLANELMISASVSLASGDVDSQRIAPDAISNVFLTAMRRLGLDPWAFPDLMVQPNGWRGSTQQVDLTDAAFLSETSTQVTYFAQPRNQHWFPYGGMYDYMDMEDGAFSPSKGAALPPLLAASGATAEIGAVLNMAAPVVRAPQAASTGASSTPRVASDFVVTPLFTVIRTVSDGTGSVKFTAPPSFGTYLVRAYAADGAHALYGAAESSLIVRRTLSLTAAVPRFVRTGDIFEAGVIVTLSSPSAASPSQSSTVNLTLSLLLSDGSTTSPLNISSPSLSQSATLSGSETQKEIRFSFAATSIGHASLLFSAKDSMGGEDVLQLELEVMAQQTSLSVATSFAINASDESSWNEGLELPAAVPGSGSLDLTAGVGYLPAQQSMFQTTISGYSTESPDATSAFVMASIPSTFSVYAQPITDVMKDNATTGVDEVTRLSAGSLGLLSSLPTRWYTPSRTDIMLNSWAVWLADGLPVSEDFKSFNGVKRLSEGWKSALAGQLVADATASRQASYNPGPYSDFYTLAWARLALGIDWTPCVSTVRSDNSCAAAQVAEDLSTARMVSELQNVSSGLTTELLVALALQAQDTIISSSMQEFMGHVAAKALGSMRVQGRTAYVASTPDGNSAVGLSDQSLALLLLQRFAVPGSAQLVQKLASYVGQGRAMEVYAPFLIRPSSVSIGLASKALTAYDLALGSTTPNLSLNASVPGYTLLQASFSPANNSVASSSTLWVALSSPPGELSFQVEGSGEVSVVASLLFVPQEVISFPLYRGIWVESAVQLMDPLSHEPSGPALKKVPLSSIVLITLQVTSPDDLGAVNVEALMPGGLEPVDPNVATDASTSCSLEDLGVQWGRWFWWWWWPMCPSQETRPSVVTFQYQHLMAGTSTIQFQAVAATAGTFVLPPIKAYVVQQPEVMGATAGGSFEVCPSSEGCTGADAALQPTPAVDCPANCGGTNGVCRLDTGECSCMKGFSGLDCMTSAQM